MSRKAGFRSLLIGTRLMVLASVLLFAGGCSLLGMTPEKEGEPALESTEGLPGSENLPFSLEVSQEINDGKELHILGSVKANTEWNPDEVVVRLTSLKDGIQVGVVHHTLKKLIESRVGITRDAAEVIKPGAETTFSLSVPSVGISDYQIVLLWGEEAEPYLDPRVVAKRKESKSKKEEPSKEESEKEAPAATENRKGLKLRVHSIEVETLRASCPYPPCDVRFRLKALLQNEGTTVIESAKLGVGFIPVELVGSQTVPEEEEEVEVPKLGLQPGLSRPFRILLTQEMSEEVAETVRPVLRIISFE